MSTDDRHREQPPIDDADRRTASYAEEGGRSQGAPFAATSLRPVTEDCYEVAGEHARGGLGKILRASDRYLHRLVAIKVLLDPNRTGEERFVREALVTARLQHPAIVPVYEAGRWPDGQAFYAMKMVDGRSLREVIDERPTLSERMALLPNVIAVADAIAYAHGQKFIHRDLKPANVLIGPFGETVVIDWGLAKDLTAAPGEEAPIGDSVPPATVTATGAVVGTPAYMPPEQARGAAVDETADVYALGAMLYHVLAGKPPFVGDDSQEILRRVIAGEYPSLRSALPAVPDELAAVVSKAMARDPAARYSTAEQLVHDLKRFQTGQLVAAHRYSAWRLMRRWVRRYRLPLGIGVGMLLVYAALLVAAILAPMARWPGAQAALAAAWSPSRRSAVSARFAQSGAPERTLAATTRALDAYVAEWRAGRRTLAFHLRMPADERDAREACFQGELKVFGALVERLAAGTIAAASGPQAAASMPRLTCNELSAATMIEAYAPARRPAMDALKTQVLEAWGLMFSGRYDEASQRVKAVADAAERDHFVHMRAQALRLLDDLLIRQEKPAESAEIAFEALDAAEEAHDDLLAAQIDSSLAWSLGYQLKDYRAGHAYVARGRAKLNRIGGNPTLGAQFEAIDGMLFRQQGKTDASIPHLLRALELIRVAAPRNPMELVPYQINLADALIDASRVGEAIPLLDSALAIEKDNVGQKHPWIVEALSDEARAYLQLGQRDEAVARLERALAATGSAEEHKQIAAQLAAVRSGASAPKP